MRRDNLFWGLVLVLLGGFFLLRAAGYITGNIFGWFWPAFLIMLGVWFIGSVFMRGRVEEDSEQQLNVEMKEAHQAAVSLKHGAGRIIVDGMAPAGKFLTGAAGAGLNLTANHAGEKLLVEIEAGPTFVPFLGPHGGAWRFHLSPEIPITMDVEAGASQIDLDLSELQVTFLKLSTGASTTSLVLPKRVENTLVDVDAGAASVTIRVPDGVAARIRIDEGLTALNIDQNRFPRLERGLYQSPEFMNTAYKAEISIDAGAGSVKIN